jgi:hypothetical protein
MNKEHATIMYNKLVDALTDHYNGNTKTNTDLIRIGTEVFLPLKNNVMRNADYDFNYMADKYSIVNTDNNAGVHWVGVYQERNNVYVFDTFGRKINTLMPEFHKRAKLNGYIIFNANKKYEHEQKETENDCGLRALAWLILTKAKGIKTTIQI